MRLLLWLKRSRNAQVSLFITSKPTSHSEFAMDVDEFDDIFLQWQHQFDALTDVNIEFPVEHSTVEIFLDDFLEVKEDITVVNCAGSTPVNIVPNFPSQTEGAYSVPSPIWSASDLQAIPPICDVDFQPTLINSRGSVATCVRNSELWGQRGICVAEETSSPASVRKKQSIAARVSRKKISRNDCQKPVKQFHSKASTWLPTPEEHILRERKRRGDMADKFLLLEKILPLQPRRQKAEIVQETIMLVKSLKLRKDELLKRRAQMKLMLLNQNKFERSPQYPSCQSKKSAFDMQFSASMEPQLLLETRSSTLDRSKPIDTGLPIIMGHSPHYRVAVATVENMTPLQVDTSSCRDLLQIYAQVSDEEILVEMLFRQDSPNLHTRVMQTVETMELEVVRGSMQRSVPCGFIECIITAKSRLECQSPRQQDTQSSARLLVGALQAAFGHV